LKQENSTLNMRNNPYITTYKFRDEDFIWSSGRHNALQCSSYGTFQDPQSYSNDMLPTHSIQAHHCDAVQTASSN